MLRAGTVRVAVAAVDRAGIEGDAALLDVRTD